MGQYWPKPGIGAVAEYQVSGTPFVTSSADGEVGSSAVVVVTFPSVTRWVMINNSGSSGIDAELKVGFTTLGVQGKGAVSASVAPGDYEANGTSKNYFVIPADVTAQNEHKSTTTGMLEFKCKSLFLQSKSGTTGFNIIAGVTGIDDFQPTLTGSNGFRGVG